ncbi:hypothetical protein [Chitinophaga qingshengii]|uniref:DUF3784 domain-containing protein n=1 Tax=Chitinophaga qingshengii TaxID=1569794 RepID=A0ABR7TQD5_9BACT|nr:hypothetical protein [Chitinophaga qingshengii]MBC9932672.1 hypothetical protein [Chitinophaga qingshengii]
MLITSAALCIAIALVVFGISYYYFTTRHQERMTILAKGLPPDFFKNSQNYLPLVLTMGMSCIGIALGAGAAWWLTFVVGIVPLFSVPMGIFLFWGLALLGTFIFLKR